MRNSAVTVLLAALVCLPAQVAADPERLGDIDIEADDAELDRRTGLTVLRGNVRVTQDDLEIRGDEMRMRFDEGELVEVMVLGVPASLSRAGAGTAEATTASARELFYRVDTGIVRLRGDARVTRGRDEFASADISYDTRLDRVVAGGGEPGERVQMTITPRRPAEDPERDEPEPEPDP